MKYIILLILFSCKHTLSHPKPLIIKEINQDTLELSYIIAAECLQCDSIEKSLVGSTVLNRVKSSKFPNDISSVIVNGYHGYCHEWYIYDKQCFQIAQQLLNNSPRDTTILYFYGNFEKKPKWIKKIIYKQYYHNFGK